MANRLWNSLTFAAVGPGATVVLPHFLNVNGDGKVPDYGWLDDANFTPSADDTNVTVTNNSAGVLTVDVLVCVIHSHIRELGGTLFPNMSPKPFWVIGGGTIGGGPTPGNSHCLTYQPGGGETGPAVFDSWVDLMAQLTAYRAQNNGEGCYVIDFDNEFVTPGPMIIPAGGPYEMSDVRFMGKTQFAQADATVNWVQIADGASFAHLRRISNLRLENLNTVTPADDTFGYISSDLIDIDLGSVVYSTGAAPLWRASPALSGDAVALVVKFSDVGLTGPGYVIDIPNDGVIFVNETSYVAKTGQFHVSGVVGATLQLGKGSSSGHLASSYPGFLGTVLLDATWASAGLRPNPFDEPPYTAPTVAAIGDLLRMSTADELAFTQVLPAVSSVALTPFQLGGMFSISQMSSGERAITIVPAAGDTIHGGLYPSLVVPPGGTILLCNDGISDWIVLSVAGGGGSIFSPPEQWAQQNVVANQVNVPLSAAVSTNFDDIKMMRPGQIVGLSTRLTEAITAGELTVGVTINGGATSVNIVHNAGSNPTGGEITLPPFFTPYVAGDLVGVRISTDAGFLPVTTDLEAWIELAED